MRPAAAPSAAEAMRPEGVVAVLTAAGLSSRMGSPKALLDWGGVPLLTHQARCLAAACGRVLVVLGHQADALRAAVPEDPRITVVVNPNYAEGRAGSLLAAFRLIPDDAEGVLVAAVDQPLLPGVVEALVAGIESGSAMAVPVFEGRRGHPALFRGRWLPELRAIREATHGLRPLVAALAHYRQEVPVEVSAVLWDLNDKPAYRAVRPARPPQP